MNNPLVTLRYNKKMDEKYRLVFRGEVLDGQHRAVVKRRLMESLNLNDAQVEKLFSGATVVLKRETDTRTAARYQALFKKAGGRLRVLPVEDEPSTVPAAPPRESLAQRLSRTVPESAEADAPADAPADAGVGKEPALPTMPTMPTSVAKHSAEIDAPDFSLQDNESIEAQIRAAAAERQEIHAPDFSLAQVGTDLLDGVDEGLVDVVVPEVDFELAEAGADILPQQPPAPPAEIGPLSFELAEAGADIGVAKAEPPPPAPDVSYLQLLEEVL